MKPLIRYPVSLFVLLLMGYTQIFAHAYRSDTAASSGESNTGENHFCLPSVKTTDTGNVFIEEEDKRISLKEFSAGNHYIVLDYTPVEGYFFAQQKNVPFHTKTFQRLSFFESSLFRVLRL